MCLTWSLSLLFPWLEDRCLAQTKNGVQAGCPGDRISLGADGGVLEVEVVTLHSSVILLNVLEMVRFVLCLLSQ